VAGFSVRRSLSLRLALAASAWVAAALVIAGALLVVLFRNHAERQFDAQLHDHMQELAAVSEVTSEGALWMTWTPSDPRMQRPLSGWYWQIVQAGHVVARSPSLWSERLPDVVLSAGTPVRVTEIHGPGGQRLRVLARRITLPESEQPYTYLVAGPVAEIEADIRDFASQVATLLAFLGLSLVGAVIVQIRFGLKPLRTLEAAIAEIRTGKRRRLSEDFPGEVEPLVREINRLLDHTDRMLERARALAGNLAHALRNPMAVIKNEARAIEGARGELLRGKAEAMERAIERQLARARIAGTRRVLGARTDVAPVADDLRFSLAVLHRERGVRIELERLDGLGFEGESEDLEEMLGNLMDNACKWARARVRVSGVIEGDWLCLAVDDDGPGIPPEERERVLERGQRLDESVAGTGLGLPIVCDIAELYEGRLELEDSELGGLRARLVLPAAG